MNEFCIAGRKIGKQFPPYVIAEMSANHNGDLNSALQIMDEAKKAGADAIKIQTYRADTITLKCDKPDFQINDGIWAGRSLYELYDWAHTPWEWHPKLFDHARDIGITIFSSPFDSTAVDLLEELAAPAYKIASFEVIDLPLIRYVASKQKPMIISTGMANDKEINEAIIAAKEGGCKELAILHCVSGYPAPPSDYNLNTIPDMQKRFGLTIGVSDHSIGNTISIASVALGASIIEKHFTLNRQGGGADDSFSMEPEELRQLCTSVQDAWQAMGMANYSQRSSELTNLKFRRSLYFVKQLRAGESVTADAIRSIRPGFGLAPKYIDDVIGSVVTVDVDIGIPVSWNLISR